jgi:hypothetical protein
VTDTDPRLWQVYQHPTQTTPADAAHYALLFCQDRHLDEDLGADAGTVMALLVANACQHGNAPVCTGMAITGDGVTVSVSDAGRIADFGPDRRGLSCVRRITGDRIEIQPRRLGNGKTVTALIPYRKEQHPVTSTAPTSAVERIRKASDHVHRLPADMHQPLLAAVFGTLAALAGRYEPVGPGRLADELDIVIADTVARFLKPGDTVSVEHNDYGTLTVPVEKIRQNRFGAEVVVLTPDGKPFIQTARFVQVGR